MPLFTRCATDLRKPKRHLFLGLVSAYMGNCLSSMASNSIFTVIRCAWNVWSNIISQNKTPCSVSRSGSSEDLFILGLASILYLCFCFSASIARFCVFVILILCLFSIAPAFNTKLCNQLHFALLLELFDFHFCKFYNDCDMKWVRRTTKMITSVRVYFCIIIMFRLGKYCWW